MISQNANEKCNYLTSLEAVHGLSIQNFKNLMLQKKWFSSLILFFGLLFLSSNSLRANNLVIGTPTIVGNNIAVTISWENSWSNTVIPSNFDAVWVFVKRQVCGGAQTWDHALVSTVSGNHAVTGGVLQVDAVADGMGVFVRRSAIGAGNIATATLTLALQTAANGVDNFQVFGIEMVNITQGDFLIGDNGNSGSGQNGYGFKSVLITNALQTAGIGAAGAYQPNNYGSTVGLPSTFPLGWNSFYCMKYEISQGQYASFLNSLAFMQQYARGCNPASSVGAYAIGITTNPSRNGIKIKTSGVFAVTPAVFGCDLNNNGTFDEAADGQNIACNWLSWTDLTSYLDWAALRPMTEFEYEKVCRGAAPVATNGEFSWSTITITQALSSALNNAGQVSETSTAAGNGLCAYGGNATANGPLRGGFAAGATTNRSQAGASWYGVVEMTGNVWEQCVGGFNFNYSGFTGLNGDGALTAAGVANTTGWPPLGGGLGGGIVRGGGYDSTAPSCTVSDRFSMVSSSNAGTVRGNSNGGRGVR